MNSFASFVSAVALVALTTSYALAGNPHAKDPLCQKYIEYDEHDNHRGAKPGPANTFCRETCEDRELLECDHTVEVLRGKADPSPQHAFMKDFFYFNKEGATDGPQGTRKHCAAAVCYKTDIWEATVVYGVPNLAKLLVDNLDTPEKLKDINGPAKDGMYRALWYLGAKEAADTMIKGLVDLTYTRDHFKHVAPRLLSWDLSDTQQDAIAKVCVESMFGDKVRYAKEAWEACYAFFALRGEAGEDALEYIKQHAGKDMRALRAWGSVDPKGAKSHMATLLAKHEKEDVVRDKKGKRTRKKFTTWRGMREDAVYPAVTLYMTGDKNGKKAIKHWLTLQGDGKLAHPKAWKNLFLLAGPMWNPTGQKKLRKDLEKAFGKVVKAYRKNPKLADPVRYAAIGLAQMGSDKGVDILLEVLGGTDSNDRMEVIEALGGRTGAPGRLPIGGGGLKIGGKDGLSKKSAQRLLDEMMKRAKFLSRDDRVRAIRAALDIRGRMIATGFMK